MREDRPSLTAQRVAMRRAAHQLLDDPKVLDDPLALPILGKEIEAALRADPSRSERAPFASYLRAFVAARSRWAEDELALAVGGGVGQYVVLGAGLDTFAYRNPYPWGMLRVFEVDHPATQAWKRTLLQEASIALPADLTFAPVDFDRQTLDEGLRSSGFDAARPTFFSWLGVTEYLMPEAVRATLRLIAASPAGTGVVFDYIISPEVLTPLQRERFEAFAKRVASVGEPLQALFDPERLTKELREMGFTHAEDKGPQEINEKYFRNRKDGLCAGSLSHLMIARV